MQLDDAPRNRQPQPGAALGLGDRAVGLLEFLEQLGLIGRGNSRAGVMDGDAERAAGGGDPDRHLACVGELDGVADKIEQHLGQPALVAMAGRHVGRNIHLEIKLLLRRQRLDRAEHVVDDVLHRIGGERKLELAGLDLGQVEHVVDQAEQMPAVAFDALEHVLRLLRRLAVDAVENQFGVAEDGVERRAQLVAHVGEELRLVLARFRELMALVLDLVEQPHVFDGDHGLVGEGGEQFDLLVGKGLELSVVSATRTPNRDTFTQQRYAEHSAIAADAVESCTRCIPDRFARPEYGRLFLQSRPTDKSPRSGLTGIRFMIFLVVRRKSEDRNQDGRRRLADRRRPLARIAKTSGRLDKSVEHGLQIEGRAADDLQHVGGRGLLLQRFAAISLSSRVFSIAITAWAAKFCTSSICLSVNGRTSWR